MAPVTTLLVFAISTGEGYTSHLLRSPLLAQYLSPHAYNCFLFHQYVGQWYFAATRNGQWWNWWNYRKEMYWFSPKPCPVEWYEYPTLVLLTVLVSTVLNATAMPLLSAILRLLNDLISGEYEEEEVDIEDALISAVEDMTGISPKPDWTLDQCGLSSIGLPQLASRLEQSLSGKNNPVSISAAALTSAQSIGDLVDILNELKSLLKADGI